MASMGLASITPALTLPGDCAALDAGASTALPTAGRNQHGRI